jgi:hypothetical protein
LEIADNHDTGYRNIGLGNNYIILAIQRRLEYGFYSGINTFDLGAIIVHTDIGPTVNSKIIHAGYPTVGGAGCVSQLGVSIIGSLRDPSASNT